MNNNTISLLEAKECIKKSKRKMRLIVICSLCSLVVVAIAGILILSYKGDGSLKQSAITGIAAVATGLIASINHAVQYYFNTNE